MLALAQQTETIARPACATSLARGISDRLSCIYCSRNYRNYRNYRN